jgi:ketosteroid isomerase-like protein
MDNVALVKTVVDRILLAADLNPVLDLVAEDLTFEVVFPDSLSVSSADSGKAGMVDYFRALGGIVTFWRIKYFAEGGRVVAVGKERFSMENCELTADSDFALVFEVEEGLITRLLVVEDLTSFIKDGRQVLDPADPLEDPLAPTLHRYSGPGLAALLPA